MNETTIETTRGTKRAPGLTVLAAFAVCLVGYSYLFGLWTSRYAESPDLLVTIRSWVNQPTGIGEDFGFLGVALLLLIAGHLIAEAASRLPARQLALRLARTGGPLVVGAVLVSVIIVLIGGTPLTDPADTDLSLPTVVTNLLLVPRFFGQPSLFALDVPVTATALFVLLTLALHPLRRYPVISTVVQLEIVCALVLIGGWANENDGTAALRVLGLVAGYLLLCALGQLTWLVRARRLDPRLGVAFGLLYVVLIVLHDRFHPETAGWWHPLSAGYALLLLLIALPRGAVFAELAPVRWLAERALPLFLSIVVIGYATLGLQRGWMPLLLAVPITFVVTGLCAEGMHRLVRRLA